MDDSDSSPLAAPLARRIGADADAGAALRPIMGPLGAPSNVGVTVLMTSELEDRYTDLRCSPYGTAFLTDAIIVQRYIEVASRLLAVAKVRASAHSDALREYAVGDDGIHLGARLADQEGLLGGRPMRKGLSDAADPSDPSP